MLQVKYETILSVIIKLIWVRDFRIEYNEHEKLNV